jgi:hypothetical protein
LSLALRLYRGYALVIAAPPLYRGVALVMPPRPCIGCSALVIGGASVYRGLCVVEKCQFFLQGIKSHGVGKENAEECIPDYTERD